MSLNDLFNMDLLPVFVILGAVLIIVIPIAVAKTKKDDAEIYGENDTSDKITENNVKIVARRTAPNPINQAVVNYVLFELSNGNRIELAIKDNDLFRIMTENDIGALTYQGKRFISFERNR